MLEEIFILYYTDGWNYGVEGVFTTNKKAKEALKILKKANSYHTYEIEKIKLNVLLGETPC